MTDKDIIEGCAGGTLGLPPQEWSTVNRILGALCRLTIQMRDSQERPYTVVGAYPEGTTNGREGTFCTHVTALSPPAAAGKAIEWATEATECLPSEVLILSIFEGRHVDVWDESEWG